VREREIGEHQIEGATIDGGARLGDAADVGDGVAALTELGREQAPQRRIVLDDEDVARRRG
jgi:hypothetical protein